MEKLQDKIQELEDSIREEYKNAEDEKSYIYASGKLDTLYKVKKIIESLN